MGLITQKADVQQVFEDEWEKYVSMIISYGLAHKIPTLILWHALRDCQESFEQGNKGLFSTT